MAINTNRIYTSSLLADLRCEDSNRAGLSFAREAILIRMLTASETRITFKSAKLMAQQLGTPTRQTEIVWTVCIRDNVLRCANGSYSAIDWMRENGIICDSASKATDSTPKAETSKTKANGTKETASAPEPAGRLDWVKLRPHVTLSTADLSDFRSKYSPEQQEAILDKLEDYKAKNPDKRFGTDYDARAINTWVPDAALKQPAKPAYQPFQFSPEFLKEMEESIKRVG